MNEITDLLSRSRESPDQIFRVPSSTIQSLSNTWKRSLAKQWRKKTRARKLAEDKQQVLSQAEAPETCVPHLPNDVRHSNEVDASTMSFEEQSILACYNTKTFENQREFATEILAKIRDSNGRISQILALAPTQSGKTGTMVACVHRCVNVEKIIPWNHVFVYTPHSSKDWVSQTKARFPVCIRDNIHHRNHTNVLMNKIQQIIVKKEKNILIIIDEAHIACKYNQTLFHLFKTLGLYDRNILYKNNIKILMFTATPEGLQSAMQSNDLPWKKHTAVVHMNVPKQYLSIEDFKAKGIVHPMRDLCGYDKEADVIQHFAYSNILEMMNHIDPNHPKYHIIRTLNGKNHLRTIHNFISLFFDDSKLRVKFPQYCKKIPESMKKNVGLISEPLIPSRINFDINLVLKQKPKKHYFIFIKDKLRCAKTIDTTHVGVLYERKVKTPKFSTMIQGLAGRATGIQKKYPSAIYFDIRQPKSYPQNFLDFIQSQKEKSKNVSEFDDQDMTDRVSQ